MNTKPFEPLWGNWYLKETLGAGSFGRVYKAQQTVAGHTDTCAVKHISIPRDETEHFAVMGQLSTRDPETLDSFYQQTAESIVNEYYVQKEFSGKEHIVQVYDILSVPKKDLPGLDLFIRMELLKAIDVRFKEGMSREEKEKEVIHLGKDICSALREMHGRQYLHRDIKPQNILVTDDGTYKLADFGMARELHSSASFLSMKGTMDYIAPEVMTGSKVSFPSDLYSLGLVLYQLLNHRQLPFQSNDPGRGDYNARRLAGEVFPVPADASPEMAEVILKACAYHPEERFENVHAMYRAFEKLDSSSNVAASTASESTQNALYIKALRMMLEAGDDSNQWERIRQFLANPELDPCSDIDLLRIKAQQKHAECMLAEVMRKKKTDSVLKDDKDPASTPFNDKQVCSTDSTLVMEPRASTKKPPAVGEYVFFGEYRQSAEIGGTSPIEWLVLEIKKGKALLLSRYGLDSRKFHDKQKLITWEKCTLRTWLNEYFLNKAFTEAEKRAIQKTLVDNSRGQGYLSENEENDTRDWFVTYQKEFTLSSFFSEAEKNAIQMTEDWIFLLSYAEANHYLGVTPSNDRNIKSRTSPTAFAKVSGAYETGKYQTGEGEAAGWWWLRSPGDSPNFAACVHCDGSLSSDYVDNASGCVRPALWVNLESGIF